MKHIVLIFCLSMAFLSAQAQIYPGIKVGGNLSNLTFYGPSAPVFPDNYYQVKPGLQAGIFAQMRFEPYFYLQPELIWISKGSQVLEDFVSTNRTNFNLNYLSLPLLAIYKPSDNLGLEFGPEFSYLLSTRVNNQNLQEFLDFQDVDVSLTAGILYEFEKMLFIDFRFSFGLFNVEQFAFTDNSGNPIDTQRTRNTSFQISLGYNLAYDR